MNQIDQLKETTSNWTKAHLSHLIGDLEIVHVKTEETRNNYKKSFISWLKFLVRVPWTNCNFLSRIRYTRYRLKAYNIIQDKCQTILISMNRQSKAAHIVFRRENLVSVIEVSSFSVKHDFLLSIKKPPSCTRYVTLLSVPRKKGKQLTELKLDQHTYITSRPLGSQIQFYT